MIETAHASLTPEPVTAAFPSSHLKFHFMSLGQSELGHIITVVECQSSLWFDISFKQQELEQICHVLNTDIRGQVRISSPVQRMQTQYDNILSKIRMMGKYLKYLFNNK